MPLEPSEIFSRAVDEGERRLDQSTLELVSTSFIAGFTIVFGIVALGIAHAATVGPFGDFSKIAGALAFGVGLVFLVVGRAELFAENFFDPAATIVERSGWDLFTSILRLWTLTLVFNLLGGLLLVLILSVEGAIPSGTSEALATTSEEIARRGPVSRFANAIVGGTLVALLSFLLVAVRSDGSRIAMAYVVGALLALGPFDHVVVSVLHVAFGILTGAAIAPVALVEIGLVGAAGNLVGGIGLVTTTHVAQAVGADEDDEDHEDQDKDDEDRDDEDHE